MKVLILDDHIAVGEGTRAILETELANCKADVFTDEQSALIKVEEAFYDVYLIDFALDEMDGIEFAEQLRKIHQEAIVVIYTGYRIEPYIQKFLQCGIAGFVSKSESKKQLVDTIQYAIERKILLPFDFVQKLYQTSASEDSPRLTERECKVLKWVKEGKTNKAIGMELNLSTRTIEKEMTSIFGKLGVGSRIEVIRKWDEIEDENTFINERVITRKV